ncbi:hypothetical protein MSAN_00848300 [Mycena sanguinolenta]|uniref:Uncharacterized protein n=1 Tax=Mycena sanguinolenta TaxID=230812 RepID=A0A8H6YWQ8_9AGAR|nr:hypothetical protein MSAN_00848300 [Mycena sanguinolenta]
MTKKKAKKNTTEAGKYNDSVITIYLFLDLMASARQYVQYEGVLAYIDSLEPTTSGTANLVAEVNNLNPALTNLETIVGFAISNTKPDSPAKMTWCRLRDRVAAAKKLQKASCGIPSHHEKRKLIHDLKFKPRPRSIVDFIANQPQPGEPSSVERPRIIYREQEEDGYYDVEEDESVLFLRHRDNHVELAVLRGIAQGTPYSDALYDFLERVIQAACDERRDVRPTHPGEMVQVGWNAGPRHARVFGLAKSFVKILDHLTAVAHDEDAIAAMTLLWSIAKSLLPIEMINLITDAVGEIGLPKIATRNVPEGTGYRVSLAGKTYEFPLYDRAPCEGIFTQDYSSYVIQLVYPTSCKIIPGLPILTLHMLPILSPGQ